MKKFIRTSSVFCLGFSTWLHSQNAFLPTSMEINSPAGIGYNPVRQSLIVSANTSYSGMPYAFVEWRPPEPLKPFATASGLSEEIKITTIQNSSGGYLKGDMFFGTGRSGEIGRITATGEAIIPWVTLPDSILGEALRGSLHHDQTGIFSNQLLVCTSAGRVFRIPSTANQTAGTPILLAHIPDTHLEGILSIPNQPEKYGARMAGKILLGAELRDPPQFITVDPLGQVSTFSIPLPNGGGYIAPEDFDFIQPDQTLFAAQSSQDTATFLFTPIPLLYLPRGTFEDSWKGDLLVTDEGEHHSKTPAIYRIKPNGSGYEAVNTWKLNSSIPGAVLEHVTFAPLAPDTVQMSLLTPLACEGSTQYPGEFLLQRTSSNLSSPLTVRLSWGGTAGPGDYTVAPATPQNTLTFQANQASLILRVSALADSDSFSETITLTLLKDSNYTIEGLPSQTIQVSDAQDPNPWVALTVQEPIAYEGGQYGTWSFFRCQGLANPLSIPLQAAGTADFFDFLPLPEFVEFNPGESRIDLDLVALDDGEAERTETVILNIPEGTGYHRGPNHQGTVEIHEALNAPPTVFLISARPITAENGSEPATLRLIREGSLEGQLQVQLRVEPTSSATYGEDYLITSDQDEINLQSGFILPSGKREVTLFIIPINDMAVEDFETVELSLLPSTQYTAPMESPETIVIFDNDGPNHRRPKSYVISHIYPMGGFYSSATAVSEVRPGYPLAVTGDAQIYEPDYGGINHASNGFLYDNGIMNNLGNPWGPNNPQGNTYPTAILPNRSIAGYAEQFGHTTGFHWDPVSKFTFLQSLTPGGWTRVTAMNENGRIVGTGRNEEGLTSAIRWNSKDSEAEYLGSLRLFIRSGSSWGTDVNIQGHIVGYSQTDGGAIHGFLLPSQSVIINALRDDLGTITSNDYHFSKAFAINDSGFITGHSQVGGVGTSNDFVAYIKIPETGKDKGYLNINSPHFTKSTARSINNHGTVVGDAQSGTGPVGFIWYPGGEMVDLNTLLPKRTSWKILCAEDINDSGHIVGWGYYQGTARGFVLTPVY